MSITKFTFSSFLLLLTLALGAQASGPAVAQLGDVAAATTVTSSAPAAAAYLAPAYPGGRAALHRELATAIVYPELAADYSVEGTVVVRLVLDATGRVAERKVVKGLGFGCDEAALRAIDSLPHWTPALRSGRATTSVTYVPLRFSLR